jgi:hypothetical protein
MAHFETPCCGGSASLDYRGPTARCHESSPSRPERRFADEPAERVPTRQITRAGPNDPRLSFRAEKGDFDRALDELNVPGDDD